MPRLQTLRHRIAAAYDRSGWARIGVILSTVAVFYAGMAALLLLSIPAAPVLTVVWLLVVATAAAWIVVP